MPDTETNSANAWLKTFVERLERLAAERAAIEAQIAETYALAKGEGFDVKILKRLLKKRAGDAAQLSEEDSLLEMYEAAVA